MEINRFEETLKDEYPCLQNSDGVSTLLVPAVINRLLNEQLRAQDCTLAIYLRKLVQKYRGQLMTQSGRSTHARCKRLYQSPGLKLQRRNFRPEIKVWAELGIFAAYMGISRCYLFVLLVQLEIHGFDAEDGLPTDRIMRYDIEFPGKIEFRETIHRRRGIATRQISIRPVPPWRLRSDLWPHPPPEKWIMKKLRDEDE